MRVGQASLGPLSDDEAQDEPEERERLGERDAQEHRGADHARRLGLARHGLDGLADEEADADAGADRGEAVHEALADRRDVGPAGDFLREDREICHGAVPPIDGARWSMELDGSGQWSLCIAPEMYTAESIVKM